MRFYIPLMKAKYPSLPTGYLILCPKILCNSQITMVSKLYNKSGSATSVYLFGKSTNNENSKCIHILNSHIRNLLGQNSGHGDREVLQCLKIVRCEKLIHLV